MAKIKESEQKLLNKIDDLQAEVKQKEADLSVFRAELKKANQRVEALISVLGKDLKLLQGIQRTLIPVELPKISGVEFSSKFIPSYISGGDYLDIFDHEDRFRFGCIVSSASGYGISAIVLSLLLKFTGRMEARTESSPHEMVLKIIEELRSILRDDRDLAKESASLFYALLDRRNFELSYCLLGDVIGFMQIYKTSEIKPLIPCSGVINLNFIDKLESKKVILNSKDRLVVCSPGLLNIKNLKGDCFGREGVLRSISKSPKTGVHELRNQIIFDAQNFLKGQELQKDITVVVMEVKERLIKLV